MDDHAKSDNSVMKEKEFHSKKMKKFKKRQRQKNKRKDDLTAEKDAEHSEIKRIRQIDSPEKKLSYKQLHKEKKKAIYELTQLQEVLGLHEARDEEEKELEAIVFGCDANNVEEEFLQSDPEEEKEEVKDEKKIAWEDEDDENILVEEKAQGLKNCHRSISSRGQEKLSDFVQEQFKKIVGQPKWAEIGRKDSDGDSEDELLQKTGNFIEQSKTLSKDFIKVQKCPSLVDESLKDAMIKSVEFHPTARVAVVGATNGTAVLFQIDGKINAKIQSVQFENFPIHAAHFTTSGSELLVGSNKYGHFFSYDMMSGKIIRIPWDKGMEQQNVRRFQMSPDGNFFVILGRYGYIHIIRAYSKEWVGSLKMNGEVIAVTFNKDGSKMFSHGDTGEVYVWDMKSRKCLHKFVDEGCVIGTSLAVSPNDQFLVAGSDTGVVNVYDYNTLFESNSPKPVKVLLNLITEVTQMKFNRTSELLAMSSSHKENAVKLVHFPSMSVFSNFPIREDQSKLNYINSLDISVNSGYLSLGNNRSTVHIFRLKHYHNY